MTDWDYAQLSHIAKESGGPRALIANIRNGELPQEGGRVALLDLL